VLLALQASDQDNISVFTPELRSAFVSEGAARLFGTTPEKMRGRGWDEFIPPEMMAVQKQHVATVLATRQPFRDELAFPGKEGVRYYDSYLTPILGAGGEVQLIVSNGRDITERKRAEQEQLEEERRAKARAQTLARVSDALAQAKLDLPAVLQVVVDEVASTLGDGSSIALLSEDEGWFYQLAYRLNDPEAHALYGEVFAAARFSRSEGLTSKVLGAKGPLFIPELTPEQVLQATVPKYRPFFERFPFYSLLSMPLRTEGRVLGLISASRYAPGRPYVAEDLQLLEALAQRASWAIANARQHHALQAERQRLSRLQDVTAALSAAKTPEEVAHVALTHGLAALEAPRGALWVPDKQGSVLQLVGARGFSENSFHLFGRMPLAASFRNPAIEAFQRGVPFFIESEAEFERDFPEAKARTPHIMRTFATACLPLTTENGSVGLLNFVFDKPRIFSSEDRAFLGIVARGCAQALERTRLFEAEREAAADREKALRELEVERQRLAVVLQEAQAASRAKDEFLAMLGHELRNPLAPILTALQLMQLRAGGSLQRERALIERQVRHVVRLVDDLLDVSRITRGKIALKKQPLKVGEIVSKAVEMGSPLFEERRHRVSTSIEPGLVVEGDEHRLTQIVSNLLTNAAKYTEPGGHIEISVARSAGGVALRVRDTGAGIGPELLPRVFELFVQGERTIDRAQGGLGLGLTIVKNLVVLHGGHVQAESEGPGKGSTFTVWLPLSERDPRHVAEEPPPVSSTHASQRRTGRHLLLVDDNREAVEALAEALETFGYTVTVAFDGPGGIEAAMRQPPELALLDIGLPVIDGYELARRLRELPGLSAIPLVALTGYGQESDRQRTHEAGFQEHLVKPVDLWQLKELLQQLLGPETARMG
jgi:PAS domain S-box-containing protein